MNIYEKTLWKNEETYLNEENLNKIEEQLEKLTNNAINELNRGYITSEELESQNLATENYVVETINEIIGTALGGEYQYGQN